VIAPAVAACGWLAAAIAALIALWAWRMRSASMEAVVRACHELRGPITASRLGLELEARTPERSPERLRAIDLELDRAALALEDLQRARGGCVRRPVVASLAQRRRFDLGSLLADVVEASRADANGCGVEISLSRPVELGSVVGDRLRIAQATRNLIANAIEHGGGPVEVSCRAAGARVRIEVVDDGPGLPAPVAELTRRARRGRGMRGRGLAIAAAIAADHGGRLASAPSDRGARLILELPAHGGDKVWRSTSGPRN
jgi:signal transduction histidine kinase